MKCHAVGTSAATVSAAALSRPLNREYSPAGLTATLWNHAPQMWSEMAAQGIKVPNLSEQEAADLFGYFASLRYFEPMGEGARGARLFRSKKCADCHAVSGRGTGNALAVPEWDSIADPVALVGKMWNHVPQMREEMSKRSIRWPSLSAQELSDILVYVRGVRDSRVRKPVHFELPPLDSGRTLVDSYGCATCHTGELAFDRRMADRTLTEVAAAMWNHGPSMVQAPATIPTEEMRKIVGWVWARQFFRPGGDPGRGRRVAESKKCVTCHEGAGTAPAFTTLETPYSVIRMTSALWKHGPQMHERMKAQGVRWPRLTPSEVENLIAYIDSKGAKSRASR